MQNVIALNNVGLADIAMVGGKNASLGEMMRHLSQAHVRVPAGFATTSAAYKKFLTQRGLDKKIEQILHKLDVRDVPALKKAGKKIRQLILATPFYPDFEKDITTAYKKLIQDNPKITVAVRSSATAEDLETASFAGQQETFLNVSGINNLLSAVKKVFASLFTDRAISYRASRSFNHLEVAISVGVQRMVRSDLAASGVVFTVDTESGFDQVVLITAAYGLGETIVQGQVNPDEFYVSKPMLLKNKHPILTKKLGSKVVKMIFSKNKKSDVTIVPVPKKDQQHFCINDKEILQLAKLAIAIETHYGKPMDIEWGKDGIDGKIYILQARPETVVSQSNNKIIERYILEKKGVIKTSGRSIGQKIGQGIARIITNPKTMNVLQRGDILVTEMTDPDWEPIMKLAAAIVTDHGGRTCHAAIIARELGIPAIVGCNNATKVIKHNEKITVSCAEGETGNVYAGILPFKVDKISVGNMPELPFKICMNLGNPEKAFSYQSLPNHGVGLARLEFIIGNMIGLHPNAALSFKKLPKKLQQDIKQLTAAYPNPVEYYVSKMVEGIATIAAAFFPKEVIFRFSDFKSNEYANLLGGAQFEPNEENPMLGFRGASRYVADNFRQCFALECAAFKRVREEMGLVNAQVMVPFVRTVEELKKVITVIEEFGLKRGVNGLKIYMMCEIPSNALMAEEFLSHVDGFSIGSNDLTQLTLGLDRDSNLVAPLFDERNPAVKKLLQAAIVACNKAGKYVGICGQAPSDYPDLAKWLMQQGIQSISLTPDTIVDTWLYLAKK